MIPYEHRKLARLITASCLFITPLATLGNANTALPPAKVGVWTEPDKLKRGNTIGVLLTRKENGELHHCTATAIGNTFILTSAGCFYPNGKLTQQAAFIPGQVNNDSNPFSRFPVAGIYHPSAFHPSPSYSQRINNSIAVAYVMNNADSKRLSNVVGSKGYWGKSLPDRSKISIYGYPFVKEGEGRPYIERNCVGQDYAASLFVSNCTYFPGLDGAPLLFTHQDNNQYIVGVVVGFRNKNDAIGAKLTPERQRILDSLNKGDFSTSSSSFKEPWTHIRFDDQQFLSVSVRNSCDVPISVAYSALSSRGLWNSFGPIKIMPGDVQHLFETRFLTFRLSIVDSDGKKLLTGPLSDFSGRSFAEFEQTRFGEYEYTTSNDPSSRRSTILAALLTPLKIGERAPCQ